MKIINCNHKIKLKYFFLFDLFFCLFMERYCIMINYLKAFRVQSFSKAAQSSESILLLQKYSDMFHLFH